MDRKKLIYSIAMLNAVVVPMGKAAVGADGAFTPVFAAGGTSTV